MMRSPTENPTDIIWIQTAFLGDIVLSTGAFALARRSFPGVRQHVITTAIGAKALAGCDAVDSLIVFEKRSGGLASFRDVKRDLLAKLAPNARPIVLQAHLSFRSSILARYLNMPTVTYCETHFGGHADVRVPRVATLHEAARVGLLLEPLGVARRDIVAARLRLTSLPLTDASGWSAQLKSWSDAGKRLIAIVPGSVWGTKRWTSEGYEGLARRLIANPAYRLALLGSDAEAPLTSALAKAVEAPELVIDLAGKTSLDDLRRVYPALDLVVSNDSSSVHYAAAFNVPTVAIFGATVPAMGFGPLSDKAATPGVDLPCRPCSDHGPMTCPLGHFKCMRDLSVDAVYAACQGLLGDC